MRDEKAATRRTGVAPEVEETEPSASLGDRVALDRAARALFGRSSPVRLGRYRLEQKLGAGAYGTVFAARDETLDRRVAIKRLDAVAAGRDGATATRQRREAQALARLQHPNAVQVFDVGVEPATREVYIAMELVAGQSMRTWLSQRRPWREALRICVSAGRGLAAAHAVGLVHRDFKPDNVLLGPDGAVKVADFGLARIAQPGASSSAPDDLLRSSSDAAAGSPGDGRSADALSADVTEGGAILGTPAYMAPELLRGHRADERSDQFAFCVSTYEALYGQRPFVGHTRIDLFEAVLAGRVRPPPPGAKVPRRVATAVLRGLRPDPDRRWPSMLALLDALQPRPTRGLTWGFGALVVAVAVAAWGWPDAAESCGSPAPQWGEAERAAVSDALQRGDAEFADATWERFEIAADRWTSHWDEASRSVCESGSGARRELPRLCLDEARRRFDSTTQAVLQAPSPDARSLDLLASLPDPWRCPNVAEPPRVVTLSAAQRREVAAVRTALQVLRTGAGSPGADVHAAFESLARRAEAAGDPSLRAEVLLAQSDVLLLEGDPAQGVDRAQAALTDARAVGDEALATESLIALCRLATEAGPELAGTRPHCDEAVAWARRAGREDLLRHARAVAAGQQVMRGKPQSQVELLEAVLAETMSSEAEATRSRLTTMHYLAIAYELTGQNERARDLNESIVTFVRRVRGPGHVSLQSALNNLGAAEVAAGHREAGLRTYEEALSLCRRRHGPASARCRYLLLNRGDVLMQLRRFHEAREDLDLAVNIESSGPHDRRARVTARVNRGLLMIRQDDPDAYDELTAAADAAVEVFGPDHLVVVKAEQGAGVAALAQGRVEAARSRLERARATAKRSGGERSRAYIETLWWSARAEVDGRDRQAAMQWVRAAEAALNEQSSPAVIAETAAVRQAVEEMDEAAGAAPP